MLTKFETKSNRVKGLSFHPKRYVVARAGIKHSARLPASSAAASRQQLGTCPAHLNASTTALS